MASFIDSEGDQWSLSITRNDANRLRLLREPIDLLSPAGLKATIDDLHKRFDLIWQLCLPQAAERGIDVNEFDRRLSTPPAFTSANVALLLALPEFYRSIGMHVIVQLIEKAAESSLRLEANAQAAAGSKPPAGRRPDLAARKRKRSRQLPSQS